MRMRDVAAVAVVVALQPFVGEVEFASSVVAAVAELHFQYLKYGKE